MSETLPVPGSYHESMLVSIHDSVSENYSENQTQFPKITNFEIEQTGISSVPLFNPLSEFTKIHDMTQSQSRNYNASANCYNPSSILQQQTIDDDCESLDNEINIQSTSSQQDIIPSQSNSINNYTHYEELSPLLPSIKTKKVPSAERKNNILVDSVSSGKYKWNKRQHCPLCSKYVLKLARHLRQVHYDDIEVNKIISMPIKERKNGFDNIRNKGNYMHNKSVLNSGNGTLLPKRRSRQERTLDAYSPCYHCKQFFIKKDLWHHEKNCIDNTENIDIKNVLTRSMLLVSATEEGCEEFKNKVIFGMISDNITKAAVTDPTIVKFGHSLYKKVNRPHSVNYVRQRMRQTARFLIKVRELDDKIYELKDAIHAAKFDTVVMAVKECSKYSVSEGMYKVAGLPMKIGYNLNKCAHIIIGISVRIENKTMEEQAINFLKLMDKEWNEEITSKAIYTLEERKYNKSVSLPLVEDIKTLNEFVNHQLKIHTSFLKQGNIESYKEVTQYVLVSLILFNRKRAGEAQRITVENFEQGCATTLNEDISNSLSAIEQALVKQLKIIEIRGKRGRKVPVLLRPIHTKAINLLLANRYNAGVDISNKYIFARCSPGIFTPVNACSIIRKITKEAKLKHPELIRSTKLRKQIGTLSQLLNLSQIELEQLCHFMGHRYDVHMNFYRLPSDIIQIAKVGKILLAAEEGKPLQMAECSPDIFEFSEKGR